MYLFFYQKLVLQKCKINTFTKIILIEHFPRAWALIRFIYTVSSCMKIYNDRIISYNGLAKQL